MRWWPMMALRPIACPFVLPAPTGARVRARLRVSPLDEVVLRAVGSHLGSLVGRDLAARCAEGRLTIPLMLAGLPASQRDGRLRDAICALTRLARQYGCLAVAIEDLDFADAREQGRERYGSRPSRGRPGRDFRRLVSGIPTGRFRDRLTQMASNAGLAVIAVDPAYTSRWGREHWLAPMQDQASPAAPVAVHHAAAVVIGRRALGHRARRRAGVTGGQRTGRRGAAPGAPVARRADRTAGPVRPSGSHLRGERPRRPIGHARPTRRPRTVRGRRPARTMSC